jgi:crossover junction endodeoxyribonuclease RuvC
MVVLGIDPGSLVTGFGVIAGAGGRWRRLAGGRITTDARAPLPERLLAIHRAVLAVLSEHRPDALAVESLFNARNPRSSLVLGHARGVVLLAGALRGIAVAEYSPREVKSALTGHGGATKEQVQFMVRRLLGPEVVATSLDESDALAVALCHAQRGEGPVVERSRRGNDG